MLFLAEKVCEECLVASSLFIHRKTIEKVLLKFNTINAATLYAY